MKAARISFVVVLMVAGCLHALAQSSRIDGGVVSKDKFGFYWESRLDPSSPPLPGSFSTVTLEDARAIHRLMLDTATRVYVGYDVLIDPVADANTFRVVFQQLAMTPELSRRAFGINPAGWTPMPTPGWTKGTVGKLPAPGTVKAGDVLQLDLLTNPATGQKVVDFVSIQEPPQKVLGFERIPDRAFSSASGPPRDFGAEDVEMSIQSPRLSVNGTLDETSVRHYETISGPVVWIHTAKRGRFLLSLVPHPELGFRKAGEVRGSSLTFTVGSDTFSLSTGSRIAPGQSAYSLYVLHDPNWLPTYPDADVSAFMMGSAERAESLIRK